MCNFVKRAYDQAQDTTILSLMESVDDKIVFFDDMGDMTFWISQTGIGGFLRAGAIRKVPQFWRRDCE